MRRLFHASALSLTALCAPMGTADETPPVDQTLDIHVDATGGGDDLGMRLVVDGITVGKSFWVKRLADLDVIGIEDVVVETVDGKALTLEQKGSRWIVAEAPEASLVVRYRARPGGRARHGHQGLVTAEWAGFDGRVVLQPKAIADFDDVRWHFELPEGWRVASAMLPIDEDSWAMAPMEPRYRASVLKSLCVGLGDFVEDKRTLGGAEFRVFTHASWEDGPDLSEKAHGVLSYFHEELGFQPDAPWALVWTPAGPKMAPVWSGSGAYTSCYERPQEGFHNWELLGHRVAHPLNEYAPMGYAISRARDHWYMEGWATYIERPALAAAEIVDLGRLNALLERHHDELAENPDWAHFPLARELEARGEVVENLHYRRGPLVVTMLAELVRRRSGRTLEQFMKHVFKTHGGFKKGLDLRAELADFSGAPLDDFWAVMVDDTGPVIPVWKEYEQALPAARPGPSLRAGDVEWSADQLHGLLMTGRFDGAVGLAEDLRETGRKHAELKRRGVSVLPPSLAGMVRAFPAGVRADVDELERRWPLEGGPGLPSGGCSGSPKPIPLPELEAVDEAGQTFLDLVAAERAAPDRPNGRQGLVALRFGHDDFEPRYPRSDAAVLQGQKIRVLMQWVAPKPGMRMEIWQREERLGRKWVDVHSDWPRTWMRFDDDVLGDRTGLLEARLVSEGKVVARRPFWRR